MLIVVVICLCVSECCVLC